jgi:crescentin
MAKLSELFVRKGTTGAGIAVTQDRRGNGNGHSAEPIIVESISDAGSRMGEENEVLRSLLNDTGRKIDELEELKQTFDKLVAPFNATLRALEQEKSLTLSLTGRLDEARAAYETLRTEFYEIEKKTTATEAEADRLREELELSREAARTLESARRELSDEVGARNARISDLEHQLAQEIMQSRTLGETGRGLQEQLDSSEKRIVELEGELAAARERLALLEDDKNSLQIAVDSGLAEIARLTRRLTESDNALASTRTQLNKVETSFAEAHAERGRLSAALDEAKEQHQTERTATSMRLDALTSRASTAERLLSEARQSLVARTEEVRAFDRKAVEATIARNNAEKRLAQIEAAHETRERQIKDLEQARDALVERSNMLSKTLKARETALARAEEKITSLTERNAHLEADVQISRTNIEKRVEDLNGSVHRERMERAVVEGALEAARKDNTRLQSEVAALRAALRRGTPIEEAPIDPPAAANEDAPAVSEAPAIAAVQSSGEA